VPVKFATGAWAKVKPDSANKKKPANIARSILARNKSGS
jgi:hypothetical protein